MLLALALTAMIGVNADAQRGNRMRLTPEQMVEKRMERLDSELKLNEEQKKNIKTLYTEFFKQDISREERRSKMEELNAKISEQLDENQKKTFSEMNARRPGRMRK